MVVGGGGIAVVLLGEWKEAFGLVVGEIQSIKANTTRWLVRPLRPIERLMTGFRPHNCPSKGE